MIPVIFIHTGNSTYLYNTFAQLRATNPGIKAYLIGTNESKIYEPIIEHISIERFQAEAHAFGKVYRHFSTNSKEFELICIQRWFILKTFMEEKGIQRCLYLDSDVLIYEDIQKLAEKYKHAGMTLCGISGHTNFVKKDVLTDFCRFVFDMYQNDDPEKKLEKYYSDFVKEHGVGGISDMTLLTGYAEENPDNVENIYYTDGRSTFDPSLEVGKDYFVIENGFKKIVFCDNKPYGEFKSTQKQVLFYTLHLQGAKAKKMLFRYVPQKSTLFWIKYLKCFSLFYYQKVKAKYSNI